MKLDHSDLEWEVAVVYQNFKKMTYIFINFYLYEIWILLTRMLISSYIFKLRKLIFEEKDNNNFDIHLGNNKYV